MAKDSEGKRPPVYVETDKDRWSSTSRQVGMRKRRFYMKHAQKGGKHTPEEWAALKAYFGGRCVKCLLVPTGSRTQPGRLRARIWILEKDHIRRVIDGGSDALENLQPLCTACNHQKGDDATDHRPAAAVALGLAKPYPWKTSRSSVRKA